MKPHTRLFTVLPSLFLAIAAASHLPAQTPATLPNVTYAASEVLNLWPGPAPGETGNIGPEHVLPNRPRPFDQITDVSVPTLSVFLPSPEKRTGAALLVIPGGGLDRLAIEHEGYEVAEWLNAQGIAAFLLKYRVPARSREQRWQVGLQDAQRAMSLIRSRAGSWQIDPESIGSMGFSAGAEINVMLSVYQRDGDRQYPALDAVDEFSTRPDFNIAIYGGGFADVRNNTLRADIASRIDQQTPPMFILHAFDDGALSSVILMNALKRANVVSELHIFGAGAHGFGVRETGLPVGNWRELCLTWLQWQGHLDPPKVRSFARDFIRAHAAPVMKLPRFGSTTLASAFTAQRRIVRQAIQTGAEVAGYKAAYATPSAQRASGLSHVVHGVLFKSGRIDASTTPSIALDPHRPLLVETEIGYVIATDIGSKLRTPRQALTAIESVIPVVELPVNLGAVTDGSVTALDLVAANGGSHRFIAGAALAPQTLGDPDLVRVSLHREGQSLHQAAGADVTGGQAHTLLTLINQIIDQGHVIHRGDVILTGALGAAHPAENGRYRADFGPLGTIEFTVE